MPHKCSGLDPVSWGRYQREASTILIAMPIIWLIGAGQAVLKTRHFFRQRDSRTGIVLTPCRWNASRFSPLCHALSRKTYVGHTVGHKLKFFNNFNGEVTLHWRCTGGAAGAAAMIC
jgi:hypothetical protein